MAEGGCFCGAVRYRVEGEPIQSDYCHCRMCQRAGGAPVVAWGTWSVSQVTWLKAICLKLVFEQLELVDLSEIEPPAEDVRDAKIWMCIVLGRSLRLLLDASLDCGQVPGWCPSPRFGQFKPVRFGPRFGFRLARRELSECISRLGNQFIGRFGRMVALTPVGRKAAGARGGENRRTEALDCSACQCEMSGRT